MRKVLAELHYVINELEDLKYSKEASDLQNLFIKIANDDNSESSSNLQNEIEILLEKYSPSSILLEISNQINKTSDNEETQEFAYSPDGDQKTYGPDSRDFWEHSKIMDATKTHIFNKNLPVSVKETIENLYRQGINASPDVIEKYKEYILSSGR